MSPFHIFILLFAALASLAASADETSPLVDAGPAYGLRVASDGDPDIPKTYIVQLREPATVDVASRIAAATLTPDPDARRPRFDRSSAFAERYASRLREQHDRVLESAGKGTQKLYSYVYGMNGFAARMTPAQAHKLELSKDVLHVWQDEIRPLTTNFSADFLELFDANNGLRGDLNGEDIVIGFIDSGVYPEHPALTDTQSADRPSACDSVWAESTLLGVWLCRRYTRMDDVMTFEPPEDWNGECETGEQFTETACNNKLIGARFFIEGAENSGPIDDGEIRSARDVDGHGTHTATTAAGNRVTASIFGTRIAKIEGLAPRARVAVYKACWLRPGDQRASCNTSDLARAIDAAVADGVDIINYSVGSSLLTVTAADDVALLAAARAGVVSVVSAGNDGPNLRTIASPAGSPWVITVGASSRQGQTTVEALEVQSPPGLAGRYENIEANFTPPLADVDPLEAALILADDDETTLTDGREGTTSDACEPLVNALAMNGRIALIQRGGCDFDVKVQNAEEAGAIAAIVYNIAGDPFVMQGDSSLVNIPALMIGQADGNRFIEEIDAGSVINAVLQKGLFLTESETGNVMGNFSSRGPGPLRSILKPDVTAPGINILAGFTPDAVNATPGEQYGYLSGTSMSAPHVAAIAALLKQAHPGWSPAAIKSSLMTSARQDINVGDGSTLANPFDFGAGHIVPNDAREPGLIYEAGVDDYDAFACGAGIDAVSQERCDELAARGLSFEGEDFNLASISLDQVTNARTVTRTVTNPSDDATSFSLSVEVPDGMLLSVDPPSLSVGARGSAEYDVTLSYVSGPLDLWRFGSLTWTSGDTAVRSPIAVRPVTLSAPAELTGFGGTGSGAFDVDFGYSGAYTARVHGLRLPQVIDGFVDNDPTKTFTFRGDNGVTIHQIDVPADQLYLRFATFDALTDGDDDLDMYVYFCPDNVNCNLIGESGGPTAEEQYDLFQPAAGRYAVLIHGFETDEVSGGPGANYQLLGWSFGENDDQGNLTVSAPGLVSVGTTEAITVNWTDLLTNTIYLGGISHNTPTGLSGLTLISITN
ncbi:MAG: S8 family serine peptidase [Pseudomonadota bacterium]